MRKIVALAVGMMVMGAASLATAQGGAGDSGMFADINLEASFLPDPAIGHGIAGGNRDASEFGRTDHGPCVGQIAGRPDHRVTLEVAFSYLRFRAFSSADTSLVIRGPDGTMYCNDDAVGLDPQIEGAFAAGEYQVFIGAVGGGNPQYRLEITEYRPDGSLDRGSPTPPTTQQQEETAGAEITRGMIMGAMRGLESEVSECSQDSNPEGHTGSLEVEFVVQRDGQVSSAATQGRFAGTRVARCIEDRVANLSFPGPFSRSQTVSFPFSLRHDPILAASFLPDPARMTGTAGGFVNANDLGRTSHGPCAGRIRSTPNHRVTLQANFSYLRFRAYSDGDTSLVIRGPDGTLYCNDDAVGLDPQIEGAFSAGVYEVYLGAVGGGDPEYRLEITEFRP